MSHRESHCQGYQINIHAHPYPHLTSFRPPPLFILTLSFPSFSLSPCSPESLGFQVGNVELAMLATCSEVTLDLALTVEHFSFLSYAYVSQCELL